MFRIGKSARNELLQESSRIKKYLVFFNRLSFYTGWVKNCGTAYINELILHFELQPFTSEVFKRDSSTEVEGSPLLTHPDFV